jgi:hypothetical protein
MIIPCAADSKDCDVQVPFKSTVNDGKYLSFWLVAQEIFG